MESNILEALPNIHGILIGIGAAFFSAFAMFAYNKIQESKDRLDNILEYVALFSSPPNFIGATNTSLISENGDLDWDGEAINLLQHARSICSHLDYDDKNSFHENIFFHNPSDEDVLATAKNICLMFHYLFVSYPFNGRSMVNINGVSERIENRRKEQFSIDRMKEIRKRINFLVSFWEGNKKSLISLGEKATEIEKKSTELRLKKSFNEKINTIGDIQENEKNGIWKEHHQSFIDMQVDYSKIIQDYFDKILIYRIHVFPQLLETLEIYETFNKRFKIKNLTISALKVSAIIFILGILFPILFSGLMQDIGLKLHESSPYFLLIITMCPYVYIWRILYSKVNKWEFS